MMMWKEWKQGYELGGYCGIPGRRLYRVWEVKREVDGFKSIYHVGGVGQMC